MGDQLQIYFHVRVLIGVVLALGITRILSGVPKFLQHPRARPLSATHLFWIGTILLMAIHFWWFQYALIHVEVWTFERFMFILGYAFMFTFFATLLVPDDFGEHQDYNVYFMAHRRAFFGLLAATVPVDLIDTFLKGAAYYQSLGVEYPVRLACLLLLCLVAAITTNRRFHLIFAAAYFIYYLSWIIRLYDVLE
ncbi:MAG: hypothetical protein M3448_09490 [Pseudomonadota bacterium]|nr:hypothetical protein [Pseudomonadota bacterium]